MYIYIDIDIDIDIYTPPHTHIHNGILLSYKKEWNLAICKIMDGPRGYYAKWNKPEKDIPNDLTYMWNLKQ